MPAQHKRPGRKARLERIRRARERELIRRSIVVHIPLWREQDDGISPGRLVAWAEIGGVSGDKPGLQI